MRKRIISVLIVVLASTVFSQAQKTEVKISLQEQFFDALLEAVFTHLDEPSVPITGSFSSLPGSSDSIGTAPAGLSNTYVNRLNSGFWGAATNVASTNSCQQTIRLKKEIDGVKTAVRFRDHKIYVPIAFDGDYKAPLIGCIEFQGWAETNIELSFDSAKQALVGHAKVRKVNLSGTNGLASGLLARFVQSSIDQKINPIEIIKLDKLSFVTPIQDAGKLRMQATGVRHTVNNKSLDVFISYQFSKAK